MNNRFARILFRVAGIYGILALVPQYFLEKKIGLDTPPPITHPEYFYGFVGLGLAWQVLFLVIASNPVRYRAAIPAGILEKVAFGFAVLVLYKLDRVVRQTVFFGCLDLVLAALFTAA